MCCSLVHFHYRVTAEAANAMNYLLRDLGLRFLTFSWMSLFEREIGFHDFLSLSDEGQSFSSELESNLLKRRLSLSRTPVGVSFETYSSQV